ncbi:hypothetical protein AWW70_21375 [Bacillus mycoides]|uniref:Uncharacterized protein n=1 Tax=Bacillus mycoides TaxID=1405 RepID=A0A109G003_BACMY|nr:hypothetical protein [Bacillus mycoides]KWU57728.1 hypothetical protein AWW70_21375 [Bacillus mycoides]
MRTFFKSFCIILGLSLVFSIFTPSSFAAKSDDVIVIDKKNAIYDQELGKYITPLKKTNGKLIPFSNSEYLNTIQKLESVADLTLLNNQITPLDYYEYWKYSPSSTSTVTGSTKKVTSEIWCNSNSCSISKSVGVTVSESYSVSATAEKNAIKANAGFTWTTSATDTSTYSFTLGFGDSGYIGFKPYLRKTSGSLKKYSNWDGYLFSKSAYAYSPKKTSSGEADGFYYFVHN